MAHGAVALPAGCLVHISSQQQLAAFAVASCSAVFVAAAAAATAVGQQKSSWQSHWMTLGQDRLASHL
jgi:hypothetical protein